MHLRSPFTFQILTLLSCDADSSRCAVFGKNWIAVTPFVWPLHVCTHFLGR